MHVKMPLNFIQLKSLNLGILKPSQRFWRCLFSLQSNAPLSFGQSSGSELSSQTHKRKITNSKSAKLKLESLVQRATTIPSSNDGWSGVVFSGQESVFGPPSVQESTQLHFS